MSDLRCETRGNRELKDQVRVFCAVLAEENDQYYTRVKEALFDMIDCAIFSQMPYSPIRDMRQFRQDLSKMSLIVFVVTKRILEKEDPVTDICLRCAETFHIPILPLMTPDLAKDSGTGDLYFRKFGCAQYLFLNQKYSTRYDEKAMEYPVSSEYKLFLYKLKVFLDSVIADSSLQARIRANFKAFMFISYRRKDQPLITGLKECIYSDPELEGVACWYDEFLTPGENFNDTIMSALTHADVFLMMLTPSMLEKDNYVIRIEYPAAVESRKPIVPVEVVPTDPRGLTEAYDECIANTIKLLPEAIADCRLRSDWTNSENAELIFETFERAAKNRELEEGTARLCTALKELLAEKLCRKEDAEYYYLLGMAYRYGVDVIRDLEKAEKYLAKAAEEDYYPALEQLVKMDPKWYCALWEYHLRRYESAPSAENARKAAEAGYQYARYRSLCTDEPPAGKITRLTKLIDFMQQYRQIKDFRNLILDSVILMARLHLREGRSADAINLCSEYIPMINADTAGENAETAGGDADILLRLAELTCVLEENAFFNRDAEQTAEYGRKVREILKRIPEEGNEDGRRLMESQNEYLQAALENETCADRSSRYTGAFSRAEKPASLLVSSSDDYEYVLQLLKCREASAFYAVSFPGRTDGDEKHKNYLDRENNINHLLHLEKEFALLMKSVPGTGHFREWVRIRRILGDKYLCILENECAARQYRQQYEAALGMIRETGCSVEAGNCLLDACSRLIHVYEKTGDRAKEQDYAARGLEAGALLFTKDRASVAGMNLKAHLEDSKGYISRKEGFDLLPVLRRLAGTDRNMAMADLCPAGTDRYWYTQICEYLSPEATAEYLAAAVENARYRSLYRAKQPADIRALYQELLRSANKLAGKYPKEAGDASFEAELALARCDFAEGYPKKALAAGKKLSKKTKQNIGSGRTSAGKEQTDKMAKRIMADLFSGTVQLHLGCIAEANRLCDTALSALEALDPVGNEGVLICAYLLKGDLNKAEGNGKGAENYYTRAFEAARKPVFSRNLEEDRLLLSDCLIHMACAGGRSVDDRIRISGCARQALFNDTSLQAFFRKTVLEGILCEAHSEVHSIMAFDLLTANMIQLAQWLAEETSSSARAQKLLFDAYTCAGRYFRNIRRDPQSEAYFEKAKTAGKKLYRLHAGVLNDTEKKIVRGRSF